MNFRIAAALLASAAIASVAPAQDLANMAGPELPAAEAPAAPVAVPAVVETTAPVALEAQLPAKSEVVLALNGELSSKTHKLGDEFSLRVAKDVVVDGHVVIPAGTRAVGQVTMQTGTGSFGKSGKMEMAFRYLDLGGKRIPISGKHRQDGEGNGAAVAGAVLAAGVIGGLLVKGKSARVPQGREFTVRTVEALPVTVQAGAPAAILASYSPAAIDMKVETPKERKAREKREKAAAKKAAAAKR